MSREENQSSNSGLKTDLSIVSDEIASLREELVDLQESRQQFSKIKRVQRAHLMVAIGVVGAFATLYDLPDGSLQLSVFWTSNNPMYPLMIHAILFMVYIPAHLHMITVWSLPMEGRWDKIHELVLPFANLFLLLGSLPLVLLIILGLDVPSLEISIQQILSYPPELEILLFILVNYWISEGVSLFSENITLIVATPTNYILGEIIVFAYPAYRYAKAYEQNMSKIQTGSKSRRLSLSTGSSGDSARIRITNSNSQEVSGENIKLEIDTPDGVEVQNVRHATEDGSGYILHDDLEPNESIRIPIELENIPGVKYEYYRGEEVKVEIFIDGERTSTERFTL